MATNENFRRIKLFHDSEEAQNINDGNEYFNNLYKFLYSNSDIPPSKSGLFNTIIEELNDSISNDDSTITYFINYYTKLPISLEEEVKNNVNKLIANRTFNNEEFGYRAHNKDLKIIDGSTEIAAYYFTLFYNDDKSRNNIISIHSILHKYEIEKIVISTNIDKSETKWEIEKFDGKKIEISSEQYDNFQNIFKSDDENEDISEKEFRNFNGFLLKIFGNNEINFPNYIQKRENFKGNNGLNNSSYKQYLIYNLSIPYSEIHLGTIMIFSDKDITKECDQNIEKIKKYFTALGRIENDYIVKRKQFLLQNANIKSAIAAIMARNLSHNIGSHVITNTKTQLDQLALNNTNLQPKISGLSKLLHYIQERQDFIAVLSSGEKYAKGPVNVKEHIFDFLAYDGPPIRHRSKERYNNYLLDNIIRSEKITRYFDTKPIELELILEENGNLHRLKSLISDSNESRLLGTINLAIPYGLNGRQAFLTILENFIRNSAKHLQSNIPDKGLLISIVLSKINNFYNIVIHDNKGHFDEVIENINSQGEIIEQEQNNKWKVKKESIKILSDDKVKTNHNNKGLKEMLICLAWMLGSDDYSKIEDDPSNSFGFYFIKTEDNDFGISFQLSCFDEKIELVENYFNEVKIGQYSYNSDNFNSKESISSFIASLPPAEIYVLDKGEERLKILQKFLPRVVLKENEARIAEEFNKYINISIDNCINLQNNVIELAYYFNKNFINLNSFTDFKNSNCFDYNLMIIDRIAYNLKNREEILLKNNGKLILKSNADVSSSNQSSTIDFSFDKSEKKALFKARINELLGEYSKGLELVVTNFVDDVLRINEIDNSTIENIDVSNCVLFKNHYETFDCKSDFIQQLPNNCIFLEGISGGNYTNSLIRNSVFTFKHFVKIIESSLTNISIIDERLFEKYKNPLVSVSEKDKAFCDNIKLSDFRDYLAGNPPSQYNYDGICNKILEYSDRIGINLTKNGYNLTNDEISQLENLGLKYFEDDEEMFSSFLRSFFVYSISEKGKSWGNYYKGKNINIYNIDTEKVEDLSEILYHSALGVRVGKNVLLKSHFISIHYGIVEKIAEKINQNGTKSFSLIEILSTIFSGYQGKVAVHSGRGDLHKFKDKTSEKDIVAFIPLSGIDWALENSKYMLTELFYNQKYYPLIKNEN